jgi:hypothetical protein
MRFIFSAILVVSIMVLVPGCEEKKTLPEGWPADIPVMRGMEIYSSESGNRIMYISLKGDVGVDEAASFYGHLSAWNTPTNVSGTSLTWAFLLTRGQEKVDVQIFRSYGDTGELQTHVKLIYTW